MKLTQSILVCLFLASMVSACSSSPLTNPPVTVTATPAWFDMKLTDVQTGETFTMNDYAGKVLLLETMAMWCATCIIQGNQVKELHKALGNPQDLISVSLDMDIHD